MTTPLEDVELRKRWLRYPAWVSASPYRKAGIFAGILLLGVPPMLRLLGVPFVTTFVVATFVCTMRLLLIAWPRNAQTGKRRHGWVVPFAYVFGCLLFIGAWATQPHFGANVCPSKGFRWTTDFVEVIRPSIHRNISDHSAQKRDWLPDGVTIAQFTAAADQAIDLFKQCVTERDVNYCRYAGSDPNGIMSDAYTRDGPNDIASQDMYKYRYLKKNIDYDISMVQSDAGEVWYTIRIMRFGKLLWTSGKTCYLSCWCNSSTGR